MAAARSSLTQLAAVCLAAATLLSVGARQAEAQRSMMSLYIFDKQTAFAPELSRADLAVFARVLVLSDDERRAMHDLYDALAATMAQEGREVREFCAEYVERSELLQDQRVLEPATKRIEAWGERAKQLEASFLVDLRVLLTREQESRWPILERELRRLKRVGAGRLTGESVDLIRILGEVSSTGGPSPALAEILERYSGDLDRALVARDTLIERESNAFGALIKEDPQAAMALFDRARRLRAAVREVNARYTRLIAAELPPDAAAAFRDRVFGASNPSLRDPTRGERYIRAAGELALSSEQAERVRAVIAEYDAARRRLLDRMAAAEWEHAYHTLPYSLAEALGQVPEGEVNYFRAFGPGKDHPLTALRLERYELDRAARAKIDALLTPEQRWSLPDTSAGQVVYSDWRVGGL